MGVKPPKSGGVNWHHTHRRSHVLNVSRNATRHRKQLSVCCRCFRLRHQGIKMLMHARFDNPQRAFRGLCFALVKPPAKHAPHKARLGLAYRRFGCVAHLQRRQAQLWGVLNALVVLASRQEHQLLMGRARIGMGELCKTQPAHQQQHPDGSLDPHTFHRYIITAVSRLTAQSILLGPVAKHPSLWHAEVCLQRLLDWSDSGENANESCRTARNEHPPVN